MPTSDDDTAHVPPSDNKSADMEQRARKYQLEMLEASKDRNIIVAMDTGSGKTHIAVMRIQVQLNKPDQKLSWFLAPGVSLATQQKNVIEKGVNGEKVALLLGKTGVDKWSTQATWDPILNDNAVIVSTPQVLLDCLHHGFLKFNKLGLLIFDEAHHCTSFHPYNKIMQDFYHPNQRNGKPVPDILGLTASPIVRTNPSDLQIIENNLDAVTRTPTIHREELALHVKLPVTKVVIYDGEPLPRPKINKQESATTESSGSHQASWADHLNLPQTELKRQTPQSNSSTLSAPAPKKLKSIPTPDDEEEYEIYDLNTGEHLSSAPSQAVLEEDEPIVVPSVSAGKNESIIESVDEEFEEFDLNDGILVLEKPDGEESSAIPPRKRSRALDSLLEVYANIDIERDPWILSLQKNGSVASKDRAKQAISSKKTNGQTQIKSLVTKARHILEECGVWATDWFISETVKIFLNRDSYFDEETKSVGEGEQGIWGTEMENEYIRSILRKISLPKDLGPVEDGVSLKVEKLIEVLLDEHSVEDSEFSGLVFVEQRVAVAAVAKIISHHPKTKDIFKTGTMVGEAEGTYKKQKLIYDLVSSKGNSLSEFRSGDINLIIATSVIEEGLDVADCHLVVCFALPKNLKSFIQRRGRARRETSSYILMYSNYETNKIKEFQKLERELILKYCDQDRELSDAIIEEDEDGCGRRMEIESTEALLTLHNSISHLNHFCNCIPHEEYVTNRPTFVPFRDISQPAGAPAWTAKIVLPNAVPSEIRESSSTQAWKSQTWAERDAAFEACRKLYDKGLINDHLMPILELEPDEKSPKRASKITVDARIDPWAFIEQKWADGKLWITNIDISFSTGENVGAEMVLPIVLEQPIEDLKLSWTHGETAMVKFGLCRPIGEDPELVERGRKATYRLFQNMYKRRMVNDRKDFAYLFIPRDGDDWDQCSESHIPALQVVAKNEDMGVVRDLNGTPFIFRRFRRDLAVLQADDFKGEHPRDPEMTNPHQSVMEITRLSKRSDFLHPEAGVRATEPKTMLLLPEFLFFDALPIRFTALAQLVPFVLDRVEKALLAADLKNTLNFTGLPNHLVIQAVTASSARDPKDYQRLEFLGDAVLKVLTSIALVDEHPLWHEGYLSAAKDAIVSNTTSSAAAVEKKLGKWINTASFTALKWTPRYATSDDKPEQPELGPLSSKILADVVESLIGVSYLCGGYDGATDCCRAFKLGVKWPWKNMDERISSLRAQAEVNASKRSADYPGFFDSLEILLSYEFKNRALLLESITHLSYGGDSISTSYQRLEFLGDAILDMVVTRRLYQSPKELSHIRMHHIRSCLVNAHLLAFTCLNSSITITQEELNPETLLLERKEVPYNLHRFLRHSHSEILHAQATCKSRFNKLKDSIQQQLDESDEYPWVDLCALGAPKFLSDIIESIIGAVWVDSDGSFEAIEGLLERIGMMKVLDRLINVDVIVNHPMSRFGILAAGDGKMRTTRYQTEGVKGNESASCELLLDNEVLVRVTGGVTPMHAKSLAAKEGLKVLKAREAKEKEEKEERKKEGLKVLKAREEEEEEEEESKKGVEEVSRKEGNNMDNSGNVAKVEAEVDRCDDGTDEGGIR